MVNLLRLSVTALLFGSLFIAGINTILDAPTSTPHSETFNSSTYPATITLSRDGMVSDITAIVTNSTGSDFISTGNWSLNYGTGVLTTTDPSNLTNNTIYTIAYSTGQQSTTLNTLIVIVVVLIVSVLSMLLILREAGISIKI